MRNVGSVLCIAGVIAAVAACSVSGEETAGKQPAGPAPVRILRTETPALIDGVLDDPCWQSAEQVRVEYAYGQPGVKSGTLPAAVRYAWDKDYLYVGYEVFDANLQAAGTGAKEGPEGNQREGCDISGSNDVFEVFVSFNDPVFFWELHQNALNGFNDVWVTVAPSNSPFARSSMAYQGIYWAQNEYLKDQGQATVKTAVSMKPAGSGKLSTVNDASDADTGYSGEMRFPWKSLGAPGDWVRDAKKIHGQLIAILAAAQNGEDKARYHHSAPDLKITGFFHLTAPGWPRYLLVDPAREKEQK